MADKDRGVGRVHRPYRQGGKPDRDAPKQRVPRVAGKNRAWDPGREGQGGEGFSEGYGGSGGPGTGPSGPEEKPE